MGSTVVTLPGGEIFQALQSGSIDASEWVGPYNDQAFGFFKAAKNYYWPGWHEPGTTLECIVNKKAYDALPSDLKAIVKYASESASMDMYAEFTAKNATALTQLQTKHGVNVKSFPEAVLKELGRTSNEVLSEIGKIDSISKRVADSFFQFRKNAMAWNKISEEAYSVARNRAIG